MARVEIVPTASWVQIATGPATITLKKVGMGQILFNDVANDVAAEKLANNMTEPGQQIIQTSTGSTFARVTGDNWEIIVDG